MRIAEINDIASVASDLAQGLRARGHDVTVIRPKLVGGGLHWAVKPVVGPVRALEWAQIIRTIHEGEFDAVHIHYAYLGMLGVLGKFPYVLHCHGSDVREITPFTRPMVATALKHAAHVFYATPDLADFVLARRRDAEFLPNPVDSEQFHPTSPARECTDVFVACSLNDIKGARRILAACRRIAEIRPEIRITAYAGGQHTEAFRKLPNVRLIPHQPRENLPVIIGRHGVVIGQVLLGVVGMAELEALACGRPVVCWYTYNNAYDERPPFVRAVDGFDIAQSTIRLVDDANARQAIGDEGRTWVEKHHKVDATAQRVEKVLLELTRR
jgi:glycosyltransferase involved in cell wall biosynthesis